jgi:hypothetical protein
MESTLSAMFVSIGIRKSNKKKMNSRKNKTPPPPTKKKKPQNQIIEIEIEYNHTNPKVLMLLLQATQLLHEISDLRNSLRLVSLLAIRIE